MNRHHMLLAATAFALSVALPWQTSAAADAIPAHIATAVADPSRPRFMQLRDPKEMPAETMVFAGIKPGNVVVELYPDGYFTRLLSKAIGPTGHDYGVNFQRDEAYPAETRERQKKGLETGQLMIDRMLSIMNLSDHKNFTETWQWGNQFGGHIALPQQVDVVWLDHYHDLKNPETGSMNMVAVNTSMFRATKPGGTYFVEDYVACPGAGWSQTATAHRSDPELVKEEILKSGFVYDGKLDIRRDPTDDCNSRDAADPVRDVYMMRFKKPANAPDFNKRPGSGNDPMAPYYGNTLILDVGGKPFNIFFHKDGIYQASSPNLYPQWMLYGIDRKLTNVHEQAGTWFYDVDANVCRRIEFPWEEEARIHCYKLPAHAQLGQTYDQPLSNGSSVKAQLIKGYVYPD